MAEKTEFLQAIDDAILDADSLERFINGSDSETVLTRLSAEYPTLQKAIKTLFENGGLPATPFKTKALMEASNLPEGSYAVVTESADDINGLYIKESAGWVKSKYDYNIMVKQLSNARLLATHNNINIDTTDKTISISGRVYRGNESYFVDSSVTFDSSSINPFCLSYHTTTNSLVATLASSINTLDSSHLIFGGFYSRFGKTYLVGFDLYMVDGVEVDTTTYRNASLGMNRPQDIHFDFSNNKINVSRLWFPFENRRVFVSSQEIPLDASRNRALDRNYVLAYNTRTFRLEVIEGGSDFKLKDNQVVVAGFNESTNSIFGLSNYTLNGLQINSSVLQLPSQNTKTNPLVTNKPEQFVFDFKNSEIRVNGVWIPHDGSRIAIYNKKVALNTSRNRLKSQSDVIIYNTKNYGLYVREAAAGFSYNENEVVLCAYNERDRFVFGLDNYTIDDVPYGMDKHSTPIAYGYSTDVPDPLNVDDDFRLSQTVNWQNIRSNIVYGWYDELVAEFPDYITKKQEGMDASGTIPIYSYHFKPERYRRIEGVYPPRPKIMIQALHNENSTLR